jgi:hypothetical protein
VIAVMGFVLGIASPFVAPGRPWWERAGLLVVLGAAVGLVVGLALRELLKSRRVAERFVNPS